MSNWPTKENPTGAYKYSSIILNFEQDVQVIERSTYSILELLGDCGGLFDALRLICGLLVGSIAAYNLKSALLSSIFRYVASMA